MAGLLVVGATELRNALSLASVRSQAGVDVNLVTVPDSEKLDAGACSRLAGSESVMSAGASFGENIAADARWQPAGIAVPVIDLTAGALRTWWPEAPATGGLFVGHDLSESSGLGVGMTVTIDGHSARITGELPDRVAPDLWQAGVVRVVAAIGPATECWLRTADGASGASEQIARPAFPDNHVVVAPYVRLDELSTDPSSVLQSSPTRQIWSAVAATGLAIFFFIALATRSEVGIYRVTGSTWPELAAMAMAQTAVLVLVPAGFATTAVFLWLAWSTDVPFAGDVVWYLIQPLLLTILTLGILTPVVQLVAAARSAVDTMRT